MTCTTLVERMMLVISMATFYALLIFILTEVMVLLGEITSRSGRYRTLLRDMNSMMRDHGFPIALRQRMRAYLRFRHTIIRGNAGGLVNAQSDNQVLGILSPQLRTEALLAMNKAGIASVPLFEQCNIPADAVLNLSVHARAGMRRARVHLPSGYPRGQHVRPVQGLAMAKAGWSAERHVRPRSRVRGGRVHRERIHADQRDGLAPLRALVPSDVQRYPDTAVVVEGLCRAS